VKVRKKRPPKWNDDAGVAALVNDEFLEWERLDAVDAGNRTEPGIPASEIFASMERDAVEEAERGNFKPAAEILEQRNPFVKWLRGMGHHLSPKAEALIAERITGKDRGKRRRGSPRNMSTGNSLIITVSSAFICCRIPRPAGFLRARFC
jgi:hypothetical protein